jgi:CxxC-x17-CxxC domain-containing protein
MEQYRDEHIACANCGASFLFSAGEAAVFAERSLAAPKRCKECRRARKEQGGGASQGRPAPAWGGGGNGGGQRDFAPRGQAPRYTGDVNEYRSPMQDNSYGNRPAWGGGGNHAGGNHAGNQGGNGFGYAPRGPRPPMGGGRPSFGGAGPGGARGPSRGGPPPWQGGGDGNYRAPSSHAGNGGYQARDNRFAGPPRGAPDAGFAAAPPGDDAARLQRRRPTTEMFSITCNSCGAHAEVPFRPAEGRDVFCQACYRARKPT